MQLWLAAAIECLGGGCRMRCPFLCPLPLPPAGHPAWDAWGSISVGVLMGAIALQLMKSNKRFLIGGRQLRCKRAADSASAVRIHAGCSVAGLGGWRGRGMLGHGLKQ